MTFLLLILIVLALIAGVVFLGYKFGDAVLEMLTQLIGMPKEETALLLFGIVFVAISTVISVKLIKHLKRYE